MERLKSNLKNYFSNGPKVVFIVMLMLMCITIGITSTRKTVVVSIDNKEMKITTFRKTFSGALRANDITVGPKDKTMPALDSVVKNNDKLFIRRAVNVEVAVDGKNLNILSAEDTVKDMFDAEDIIVQDVDKVVPSLEEPLIEGEKIVVTRYETKLIKETKPVDFSTVVKKDDNMEKGATKVEQEGQTGEKQISTRIVYENGKEIARQVVSETVTKEPIQKIVAMGTLGVLTPSRGGRVLYKDSIRVKATAYSNGFRSTGKNPGDDGYGYTATGTKARRSSDGYSSVAVDPRIIPLGTRLYVEGYGYAIAEDTGGAIKGNSIDVFYDTDREAESWGVRWVNVYILK